MFEQCFGIKGGGIFFSGNSEIFISRGQFIRNNASKSGGAIYIESGNLNISESRFEENSAEYFGSDIYAIKPSLNSKIMSLVINT